MRVNAGGFAALAAAASLAGCATEPAEPAHPDFTGVWSPVLTTQADPYWQIEDLLCFSGCPTAFREQLVAALDDPANAGQPPDALIGAATAAMFAHREAISTPDGLARIAASTAPEDFDLAEYCDPYGLVRQSMNALPLAIRAEDDGLIIQYEEWNLSRTIYLDGRAHPADMAPTPLGHSVGRYEGDALVVDTVAISGDYYFGTTATAHWGSYSDATTTVERYTMEDDPRRLILELTITDPATLTEPYIWTKTWLFTPDIELVQDSCEDVPGQFEGSAS